MAVLLVGPEQENNIKVVVSPSEMEAYVILNPDFVSDGDAPPFTFMAVLAALKQSGVIAGIDEAKIHTLISEKRWDEKILVARGRLPQNGENGAIEYFFNTEKKPCPQENPEGRVDFREIGLVSLVQKDQLLARRIPAKPGKAGTTVTGRVLEARHGEEVFIKPGLNTYFTGDGELELRASKTGSVSLVSGAVQVDDTLKLRSGVNFASGNVDFPGDVVILGDVESGFVVKSTGKIEVNGVVEDALLEAGNDVLVKGGFVGSGKGIIRSQKDVYLRFVENQVIEAGGNVHISTNCVQAQITAGGNIELLSGVGTVVGGHLKANGDIQAKVIGNDKHATTVVEINGENDGFEEKIREKQESLASLEQQMLTAKKFIAKMQRLRTETDEYDPFLLDTLRRYQDQLQAMDEERTRLKKKLNELLMKGGCKGSLQVITKIYPGTKIIMGGVEYSVQQELGKTTFKRVRDEIVAMNARHQEQPVGFLAT